NIESWTYLLSNRESPVRLAALKLLVNVCKYSEEPNIIFFLKSSFINLLLTIEPQHSEEFYRLLTAFLCDSTCPRSTIDAVVRIVLNMTIPNSCALHMLQFLVAIAEAHSHLYHLICSWSVLKLKENTNLTRFTLFSCLVYAPLSNIAILPKNHLDIWGDDPWLKYLVARSAMRTGHLKLAALPLLNAIYDKAKSFKTRIWLNALRYICNSAPSEFTVQAFECSVENLNNARLSLSSLCSSRNLRHYFIFGLRFVECLSSMYATLHAFLIVLNTNLSLAGDLTSFALRKTTFHLRACALKMEVCRGKWLDLYKRCFDADNNTLTFLELYSIMCSVFSSGIQMLTEQQPLSPLIVSVSSHYSLANRHLRSLLLWAKVEIGKMDVIPVEKRLTKKNLELVVDVFKNLSGLPICVPRFFFQQLKYTQIKLNVLPQPELMEKAINVSSNHKVPILVEGAIESTHMSSVYAVTVEAVARFSSDSNKDYLESRTVTPSEGKFFSAQFLLSFPESCTMEFFVTFVDQKTRRQWQSDVTAELKIFVSS
ncbi:unnamed protein product, partial [Thelazia callipaeda]|uniref:Integrator complex subunit 7 n=1 Tax=Thelazia callipaeda TaxID=103827 RepID=A0A0N5CSA1_THECL